MSADSLRANLTGAEKTALKRLMRNHNVVISKPDKGDTTVVMNTEHYLDLSRKHLSDKNTYQLLETDPTANFARQFNSYLDDYLRNQTIYFMPKVHKDPLKLRPIVSCTNGPTYTASAYVDQLLEPLMRSVKSYLNNSMQLIHILRTLKVPPNAYLITLDIESLCTNISHEEAITAFLKNRNTTHIRNLYLNTS